MQPYLKEFYNAMKRYEGSLVRVSTAIRVNKNAKEYLIKLAKMGLIEKAAWGWYYISPKEKADVLKFLKQDQNFKAVVGQSAASFWNHDFVHRETLNVAVNDKSFGKALESFAQKKGWHLAIEYDRRAHKIKFERIKKLAVEGPDEAVIECIRNWAFADAIAVLVVNKSRIDWQKLTYHSYWARVSGTNVRVRQVIEYAAYWLNKKTSTKFKTKKIAIKNDFLKRELDEAIEKVLEFE